MPYCPHGSLIASFIFLFRITPPPPRVHLRGSFSGVNHRPFSLKARPVSPRSFLWCCILKRKHRSQFIPASKENSRSRSPAVPRQKHPPCLAHRDTPPIILFAITHRNSSPCAWGRRWA